MSTRTDTLFPYTTLFRSSVVSDEFRREVDRITRTIIEYTSPQGPGGYDYLSVDGRPVLNDINTGRFNGAHRSEEHTSELQSLMRISYAVFCLKNKNITHKQIHTNVKLHSQRQHLNY